MTPRYGEWEVKFRWRVGESPDVVSYLGRTCAKSVGETVAIRRIPTGVQRREETSITVCVEEVPLLAHELADAVGEDSLAQRRGPVAGVRPLGVRFLPPSVLDQSDLDEPIEVVVEGVRLDVQRFPQFLRAPGTGVHEVFRIRKRVSLPTARCMSRYCSTERRLCPDRSASWSRSNCRRQVQAQASTFQEAKDGRGLRHPFRR